MLNLIFPMEGYVTVGNFYKNPIHTFGTTIIFDSDEAFEDFCVAPVARICYSSNGEPVSCGGAYTEMYTKCMKAGMKFFIRDRQSKVYKRKVVTKRVLVPSELGSSRKDVLVQLSVQNLVPPALPGCFLYLDRVYHERNAVRLVIQDLMEQGKTSDQVCEVIKTCFDSFITKTAYAELDEAEKEKYDEIKYKTVSCYCRGLHLNKFLATASEYGIKIEPVIIQKQFPVENQSGYDGETGSR